MVDGWYLPVAIDPCCLLYMILYVTVNTIVAIFTQRGCVAPAFCMPATLLLARTEALVFIAWL